MAGPLAGSEGDSIECWENYSAGEVLVQGLAGQIHQEDVEAIVRAQKQMLQRFEKTNEMLSNCNALSASRYTAAHQEFAKHSAMLLQTKKDLDYIFKKIRNMRTKLESQYPQAVEAISEQMCPEREDSTACESTSSSSCRTAGSAAADDRSEASGRGQPTGGEQSIALSHEDQQDQRDIAKGIVKRVSGKLHHISSSDSSTSSSKSSCSSSDS